MKDQVKQAHETMEQCIKEHQEKTMAIEQDYREKERQLHSTLRKKMDMLIQEQTEEISTL